MRGSLSTSERYGRKPTIHGGTVFFRLAMTRPPDKPCLPQVELACWYRIGNHQHNTVGEAKGGIGTGKGNQEKYYPALLEL
jgi:hypothetical protein